MRYEIVPIDILIPLEKVFFNHLKNLEDLINKDGFVLKAIIADKNTGMILDGSHRYVYFLKNGYKEVPVHFIDYSDENVRVGTHLNHRFLINENSGISKKECIDRALSADLFTPRTTRHFFTFRKEDISLPLSQLKTGDLIDVAHLISDANVVDEIAHNEKYIDEINEEVETIINYLSEVSQIKKYLTEQIALMKQNRKIGFFPGKFHPPHVGHILTMLKILPKYKKLIIGVTEDIPNKKVINISGIISTLNLFFSEFDNVEIIPIKGVLIERETLVGLPKFDVLLSGNDDVLVWAKNRGVEGRYVSRSEGFLCSGTEIRDSLCNNAISFGDGATTTIIKGGTDLK